MPWGLLVSRSYLPPVKIGETMRAAGLGRVVEVGSSVKNVKQGDIVYATCGQLGLRIACEVDELNVPPIQAGQTTQSWMHRNWK